MVVFICNACGDSLKKQQVEKHLMHICRQNQTVSCVDCSKDFTFQSYREHVRCISEDEKYSGKNYQPKVNKGQVKQEQWTQRVQDALSNAGGDRKLASVLEKMLAYDNIPRKKAKFENFMRNSFRSMVNPPMIERIWNIVETQTKSNQTEDDKSQQQKSTGSNGEAKDDSFDPSPAKKMKNGNKDDKSNNKNEIEETEVDELPKFRLNEFIMAQLAKKPSGMAFSKLFKRVKKASTDESRYRISKKMETFDDVKLEKALTRLNDAGKISYSTENRRAFISEKSC